MICRERFLLSAAVVCALLVAGCDAGDRREQADAEPSWNLLDIVEVDAAEPELVAHARPIVWEIEPLGAHGGMSGYMLAGVEYLLNAHADELNATYRRFLRDDPMLCGEVTAHITTESGVFLFCSLEENTTGNEELGTELLTKMQDWDWPSSGRDVFRIHLHLRRNLGTGRGFIAAGSQELKPAPLPPPPPVEEEPTEEGAGVAEDNPQTVESSTEPAGIGSSPEGYGETGATSGE